MIKKTKRNRMKSSFSEKSVDIIIYTILGVLGVSCILPFIHLAALSLSTSTAVSSGSVTLIPIGWNLDPYKYAMEHPAFLRALSISVVRTVAGVLISLTMLILTAYPLSKSHEVVPLAPVFKGMMIVAMLTSGGLIPMYLVMSWIKLTNTFWALVLPGCLSLWNCFMVMNFFRTIPSELEEAAVVDGANSFQILVRIYLPLSVPIIATMAVFVGVGHWNDWFSGMLYIARSQNYPLQTYLQQVITIPNFSNLTVDEMEKYARINNKNNQAAQILIATVPILLIYPFLQRYFMTGLTLGGVKG
ncbi:MAG: carbohydrate ABC transporter permease [Caldicoprobacterales bacterium]|jgi:putative aldouronate transport system permease protein|nr:carbohydrate ABC transporter permease [Clostridiales bacterium]